MTLKSNIGATLGLLTEKLISVSSQVRSAARKAVVEEEKINIGDHDYFVPQFHRCHLSFEADREPWMDAAFAYALKRKDGGFIDIGANRGQSLRKKLALSPTRAYLGFEPQTSCADALRRFIVRNRLRDHYIVPAGLADEDGIRSIWYRSGEESDAAASIIEGYRPKEFYSQSDYIAVFQGDSVLPNLISSPISTIKIDVEGAEPEVLAGLRNTLTKHGPTVIFEVLHNIVHATGQPLNPPMIEHRNARAESISKIFSEADFAIFNIRDGRLVRLDYIQPEVSGDMSTTNYLAIPTAEAPEDGFTLPFA